MKPRQLTQIEKKKIKNLYLSLEENSLKNICFILKTPIISTSKFINTFLEKKETIMTTEPIIKTREYYSEIKVLPTLLSNLQLVQLFNIPMHSDPDFSIRLGGIKPYKSC